MSNRVTGGTGGIIILLGGKGYRGRHQKGHVITRRVLEGPLEGPE